MGVYIWTNEWLPNANTIAYYPLTAETTANDKSGNGYNLTNNGVTFGTVGNVSCATFNGSSYLNRSESLFTGSSTFTVNLWYQRTGTPSGHYNIFSVGTANGTNSFIIWLNESTAKLNMGGWTNNRDTGYIVPLNTWINICITHNSGTLKVYINNSLVYTGTVSYGITSTATSVGAGVTNGQPMIGYQSELIVEDKARSEQEISDYYNLTKSNYGL